MKYIATIRPTETREIPVEADDAASARELLEQQIPEGWQLIAFRGA